MTKLEAARKEYTDWCRAIGINTMEDLSQALNEGRGIEFINLCEARQERKYAEIADQIYWNKNRNRIVMMAGPSSSGKTSSSLRIAQQCRVLGLNPKVIELDNYFVDREHTPKDSDGNYDFEALEAMDLKLLNSQLNDLFAGKEVELPRFDFKQGKSVPSGKRISLGEKEILIMEGIHALDPAMVPDVDNSRIFRVYASALTSLNVDENNNISTSDNRLLRRIVRDFNKGAFSAQETISNWPNVRRAEVKWIYPYQEDADVLFNSAYLVEFAVLRSHAERILATVPKNCPEYSEAHRLLQFLHYFVPVSDKEIPLTSLLRGLIGGGSY